MAVFSFSMRVLGTSEEQQWRYRLCERNSEAEFRKSDRESHENQKLRYYQVSSVKRVEKIVLVQGLIRSVRLK